MDGDALCARFSIATNRLGYCGPADSEVALYRAIVTGRGDPESRRRLAAFEALEPYLRAIAERHGLDPFDRKVVEAYWIGNELLDDFPAPDFRRLLSALERRGLPRSISQTLSDHLPEGAVPHHVFHVAFVGVGAVTGHVPTTLENVEACRPRWGTVESIGADRLEVRGPALTLRAGRLLWASEFRESVAWDPRVLPGLSVRDRVALHWHWPALRLSEEEGRRLVAYSERSIAAANRALPALDGGSRSTGGPSPSDAVAPERLVGSN